MSRRLNARGTGVGSTEPVKSGCAGFAGAERENKSGVAGFADGGAGMMFKQSRWREFISGQLDLFVREHSDVIEEARERLALYNAADRDAAEELYGDYVDAVETGTELLADIRDHFKWTLEEELGEQYERDFNRAVAKRLPEFALEIENR